MTKHEGSLEPLSPSHLHHSLDDDPTSQDVVLLQASCLVRQFDLEAGRVEGKFKGMEMLWVR